MTGLHTFSRHACAGRAGTPPPVRPVPAAHDHAAAALSCLVFAYVFPKIGQGFSGHNESPTNFTAVLVPGLIAVAINFSRASRSAALPPVQEFSVSKEIEDRVLAPVPVWMIGLEKIVAGALQSILASGVVLPGRLPRARPWRQSRTYTSNDWPLFVVAIVFASLLARCGRAADRNGARSAEDHAPLQRDRGSRSRSSAASTSLPWASLSPIPWLKYFVLFNPLVYMSEGLRASLTPQLPHMPIWAITARARRRLGRARAARPSHLPVGRVVTQTDDDPAKIEWLRPSPRLATMRRAQVAVATALVAIVGAGIVLIHSHFWLAGIIVVVVAALRVRWRTCSLPALQVRAWGYCEREDDLLVRRGVAFRRLSVVPYGRMQFVDVTAGPFERSFGLATVRMHTAAAFSDARIPGLSEEDAAHLRDQLAALGEARATGL